MKGQKLHKNCGKMAKLKTSNWINHYTKIIGDE